MRHRYHFYVYFIRQMILNIECPFLVYLGIMSKTSVDKDGNPKYSDIDSENDVSPSKVAEDGISLISKVKPLKFCLMSKVFHGISLISKVFRESETLDKTLEVSRNV